MSGLEDLFVEIGQLVPYVLVQNIVDKSKVHKVLAWPEAKQLAL